MWVYESNDSEEMERPVCRSIQSYQDIVTAEDEMRQAIISLDFHEVDKVYCRIVNNHIDIDAKLMHEAETMHLKLKRELEIREFIKSVAYVPDYKRILKSVKILEDKVASAKEEGVNLDPGLMGEVNRTCSRLISERNLRFQMENQKITAATKDNVENLTNLMDKAQENSVAPEYMEQAEKLQQQMNGNIKAREILQMLLDYPERVYPEPESMDPKKKKAQQKPKEDEKKKKKRKKREPPFPMPEWATDLQNLISTIHDMENLIGDAENLQLDQEFIARVNQQLARFKKEVAFRTQQEELARLEAEARKNKKKQKKK